MPCYKYRVLHFQQPIFKTIPRTYLITMPGSKRYASYMAQLKKYRPTAEVIVVINAGFKKCKKPAWVNTCATDLWHVNCHIAKSALRDGVSPILILEDDVLFTDSFFSSAQGIENFVRKHPHPLAYKLGCMPLVSIPSVSENKHIRSLYGADTHAVIYNRAALLRFAEITEVMRKAWYPFHDSLLYSKLSVYFTKLPCAIQIKDFTTENSRLWNIANIPKLQFKLLGQGCSYRYYQNGHILGSHGGILTSMLLCIIIVALIVSIARSKT